MVEDPVVVVIVLPSVVITPTRGSVVMGTPLPPLPEPEPEPEAPDPEAEPPVAVIVAVALPAPDAKTEVAERVAPLEAAVHC